MPFWIDNMFMLCQDASSCGVLAALAAANLIGFSVMRETEGSSILSIPCALCRINKKDPGDV